MRFLSLIAAACAAVAQDPSSLPPLSPATAARIAEFVEVEGAATAADLGTLLDDANTLAELIERESAIGMARRSSSLRSSLGLLRARRADTLDGIATALVARAGLAELVSAAIENGALTRDRQGLLTTLRFNALGVYGGLLSQPGRRPCANANPLCDTPGELALRGLSAALTFDNQHATATANPVTGGGRLAAVSIRYQSLDRRASIHTAAASAAAERAALLRLIADRLDEIGDDEARGAALRRFRARIQRDFLRRRPASAASETIRALSGSYQRALAELAPAFRGGYLDSLRQANLEAERALVRALSGTLLKPMFSVEFSRQAPHGQAPTSQIRYALDLKLWKNGHDYAGLLTANAGASVYERIPAGLSARPWRDAHFALQFDRKLGAAAGKHRTVFSLAAHGQYQINNAILQFTPGVAAEALNTRGLIAAVQAKLTIRLTKAVSIPAAFSWATRTELSKASTLRAQFGISINFDSLVGKE